jgi:hypothetical protein
MNDTIHQIFQDGDAYKIRITRLGEFMQEADGFSSYANAASWIAQAQRLGSVRAEQQSRYLRHTCVWSDLTAAQRGENSLA